MYNPKSTPVQRGLSRFFIGVSIGFVVLLSCIGCQTDPRARMEIALLRSELVALEDRYALLRNRCGDGKGDDYSDLQIEAPSIETNQYVPQTTPRQSRPSRSVPPEELILDIEESSGNDVPNNGGGFRSERSRPKQNNTLASQATIPTTNFDLAIKVQARDRNNDQIDDGMIVKIPFAEPSAVESIQISMLDPDLPNGQQRIGYWKYDREALRKTNYDRRSGAFDVEVDWSSPPRNPGLLVFARVVTNESVSEGSDSVISRLHIDQDFFDGDPEMTAARSASNPQNGTQWRPNR